MLEKKQAKGERVEALDNKPELAAHLVGVWSCFCTLSHSRGSGMSGADAIRMTDIKAYLDMIGLYGDSVIDYCELIVLLDVGYMKFQSEARKSEQARVSKNASPGTHR